MDKKLKQINLATNSDFNAVLQQANKNKEKIQKLATFDLSYFLGKTFLDDDGFKNKFAYQPTFNMLQLKKDKSTERWKYVGNQKNYTLPKIFPLHNLLPIIKQFDCNIEL